MGGFQGVSPVPDDWVLEVRKKQIRHFYFRVLPGQKTVMVSCPASAAPAEVARAIHARSGWIRKQVGLARTRPLQPVAACVTGETHLYQGLPHVLTLREVLGRPHVFLPGDQTLVLSVKPGTCIETRKAVLENWYRSRLVETAGKMVKKWEPVMGVTVNQIRARKMKTRWGSCNIQAARIWLNLELVRMDRVFLEYVLVHEMVHLLESGHSPRFYAHMDRLMPGWPYL
ncbi:MAG: M48 family metallopeptidase, partial [Desulfotignum sp.]